MVLWRRMAEEAIDGWPRRRRLLMSTMVAMEIERERDRERGERYFLWDAGCVKSKRQKVDLVHQQTASAISGLYKRTTTGVSNFTLRFF